MTATMRERIESKLLVQFKPQRMALDNESHRHSGPQADSHWNLILVAEAFAGRSRLQRQRDVYAALADEFADGIHALTMKLLTPAEWEAAGGAVANPAPPCRGGSK